MTTTKTIEAGTIFRILLGMPRTGTITKVTAAKVYFTTINPVGEIIPSITTRAMFDNAAMIEVIA